MQIEWQAHEITGRLDGSYVIIRGGHPYHVPEEGEWAALWAEVHAYAQAHPEQVQQELPPPPPTPEELLQAQIAEVQGQLHALDSKYLTPRVLSELPDGAYAQAQKAQHEAEAAPLRAQLAGLMAELEALAA